MHPRESVIICSYKQSYRYKRVQLTRDVLIRPLINQLIVKLISFFLQNFLKSVNRMVTGIKKQCNKERLDRNNSNGDYP